MALINCPECEKRISDKASTCPHCGYPIQNLETGPDLEHSVSNEKRNEILCPNFPDDLKIGQQLTNWLYDSSFKGIYNQNSNTVKAIPSGKANVLLHTHGLRIMVGMESYDIHNSQIINIQKTSSAEIAQAGKSVIGRAVVGGIIMGPLGAVVGGISGTGTKDKLNIKQYAVINFWNTNTKSPQSILIQCDKSQPIEAFIHRQKEEDQKNKSENRIAEKEHLSPFALVVLLIIVISIILIILS